MKQHLRRKTHDNKSKTCTTNKAHRNHGIYQTTLFKNTANENKKRENYNSVTAARLLVIMAMVPFDVENRCNWTYLQSIEDTADTLSKILSR